MNDIHSSTNAENFVDRTTASVNAFADDARSQAAELTDQVAAAGGRAYRQARRQVRNAATTVAQSVEQQPLIAFAMVGLACAVTGFLLGRR